ncbi:hypothetical protein E3Q19_01883 [Wallemia mellicola]|nr:hypothetical protein E3Q19_01883 [Wallemia mellicola]
MSDGYWLDSIDSKGLEGQALFEHRRKLWTQPTKKTEGRLQERRDNPGFRKLIELIDSAKDRENFTDIWDKGIRNIYNNLVQGQRLSQPLPLEIIVQVVCKAAWVELGIWPLDYVKTPDPAPIVPRAFMKIN